MHNITLDFSNPGLPQVIDVMQSDAQSRFIGLTLYDGGVPYSAPSGAQYTVQYRGSGANNVGWYDTIQLSSGTRKAVTVSSSNPNVVTLELAEQALRVNGKVEVSLCVVNNTGYKLNTFPIICRVTGAPYVDPVAVRSYFYVTGLTSEQWLAYATACQDAQKRAEDAAAKLVIDDTLTHKGQAADAKATGQLKEDLTDSKIAKRIIADELMGSITNTGSVIGDTGNNRHTAPIKLIKGQTIKCKCMLWTSFSVISKYNGEGVLYTPIILSDKDEDKTYSYTADDDISVSCSYVKKSEIEIIEPFYDVYGKINALHFGFKNDGIFDNSKIMDIYIDKYSNKPIYFPEGTYCFSKTINFPDKFYLLLEKNAIFKATNKFNGEYFLTIRKGSNRADYTDGSYLDGGVFDCNYQINAGIGLNKCRQSYIKNLTIKNTNKYGIVTRTEETPDGTINLENIVIYNSIGILDTIGIYDNAFDTHGRNIEILNFQTAFQTVSGRWYDVSAWFSVANLLAQSVFAYLDGYDIIFSGVAIDTYRYGFKTTYSNYGACISDVIWIRNSGVYTNDLVDKYPLGLLLMGGENPLYLVTNVSNPNEYGFSMKVGGKMENSKIRNVRIGNKTYDFIE